MSRHQKLSVCSILGNPADPAVWSGTPSSLCAALQRRDALDRTFSSTPDRRAEVALKALSKLWYGGSIDLTRGVPLRRWRAAHVHRQMAGAGSDVLHLGNLDIPEPREGRRHYLFCDSTFHSWARHDEDRGRYTPRMLAAIDREDRASYRRVAHIFTASRYVQNDLIDYYGIDPGKVTVVGTGLGKRVVPFTGRKDFRAKTALFVAKQRFRQKGAFLLLDAFRMAVARDSELRLVIVGDATCQEYAAGIPNVRVFTEVSRDEIQALFDEATLYAMPAYNEPYGLVYLEALSCQMPLLAMNRNALPDFTQDGRFGFLLDEATPEAVSAALLDAFSDPARLERMGLEGQAHCLVNYGWDLLVDRMLSVIRESAATP